jgi:glycosyltransferase involved in cell wall biosynthesis
MILEQPNPLVSVLVTSLNRPDYLMAACSSVLAGEYQNVELLICDDASDVEEARRVAGEIAAGDERVKVLQNPTRLGQFRSISNALSAMEGEYFAILNDDDLWADSFLQRLVPPLADAPDLVAAFCDHWIIDGVGAVDEQLTNELSTRYRRTDLAEGRHVDSGHLAFALSAFPTVVASLFRTSAVDLDSYLGASMDTIGFYDLWLQVCTLGDDRPVWYEPRRSAYYRVHSGQLSSRPSAPLGRAKAWIFEEALDSGRFANCESSIVRQLGRVHYALGMYYLRQDSRAVARMYLVRAFAEHPGLRQVVAMALTLGVIPGTIRNRVLRG